MKRQIDKEKIMTSMFPPSPRDKIITRLGIASFIFYALAAVCAWQIGGWWGIGLVVSIFAIDTSGDMVHEQHRQELIELHGKLVCEIAENSDILDGVIPVKNTPA